MRHQQFCKVKGLRGLHTPQAVAVYGLVELVVVDLNHSIDTGQNRYGCRCRPQPLNQPVDNRMRDKWPCGVMDENVFRAATVADRGQAVENRLLARSTTDYNLVWRIGAKSLAELLFLSLCDHNPDPVNGGVG